MVGRWHVDFPGFPADLPIKPATAFVVLQTPGKIEFRGEAGSVFSCDLPVGSILVFDGDVSHRGVSFAARCAAMHVYLDVPEVHAAPNNKSIHMHVRMC